MYAGAMYTWRWFKELTRTEEQVFCKTMESADLAKPDEDHKSHNHPWSASDLILVTACFQMDIIYLCTMSYMFKNNKHPGFLHILIMYITWGPALIYMEIFLGQYVQHGCLYLKNISPLTCSTIGYGMLLTTYFFSISAVGRLADAYTFLFRSFSSELPWMVCPKSSTPETCIDRSLLMKCYLENRKDDCYPKIGPELFSSRIYYKSVHSTYTKTVALLFFGWFTIYIAMKQNLNSSRNMVRKLLLFMLVLFFALLLSLTGHIGLGLSVAPFFSVQRGALFSIDTWIRTFKYFLRDHAIVRGGWQLIGRYVKPGPEAANLTIYSCILTYVINLFCQIFSTGILGVLIFYMKVSNIEKDLYFPKYSKVYNFFPFALGMLHVRQLWSIIFFGLITFSSFSYTVANMTIIEESLYDNFPVMLRYRNYIKVILCAVGFLTGVISDILTNKYSTIFEDDVVLQIGYRLTIIVVLILTFSVGYIYGIERFSDDMNFLNGSQPTTYLKICWKSLPFGILILIGHDMISIEFPHNNLAKMMSNIIYVVLLALALLHLFKQIVISIKERNVVGILFQATPLWGPPLPEDRKMRNTYNPREETRYWRKKTPCTHHCLVDKDFIPSIVFREVNQRSNKTQRDNTLQPDFTAAAQQLKQNRIVVAIDKVSSTQLETFEEQVKQKMMLEKIEERATTSKPKYVTTSSHHVTATESTDTLDYRIEQMINRAAPKIQLEKENNETRVQKIPSKTKQRRLPTFIPKETPKPKKISKITTKTIDTNISDKDPTKIHTYAIQVPHFVLESAKNPQRPALSKSTRKKDNFEISKFSPSKR